MLADYNNRHHNRHHHQIALQINYSDCMRIVVSNGSLSGQWADYFKFNTRAVRNDLACMIINNEQYLDIAQTVKR